MARVLPKVYDAVIVGAGVMGSSAAYWTARSGKKDVLLLEQFDALHCHGSSHGGSRITRRYYHTKYYTEMMKEAYRLWEDIERESRQKLFYKTGGIMFGEKGCKELSRTLEALDSCGVPHTVLTGGGANKVVPQLNIPEHYQCIMEEDSGIISAGRGMQSLQNLFLQYGGELVERCQLNSIIPGDPVTLLTERGNFQTEKLVLTPGSWTSSLLNPLGLFPSLKVVKTENLYWAVDRSELPSHMDGFPTFRAFLDDSRTHFYGLKAHEHPGLCKICYLDGYGDISQSSSDERVHHQSSTTERVAGFIRKHFKGFSATPTVVEKCIYTITPDEDFFLDTHPQYPNIVVGAGFSGHGFKMAPVIGKILCSMATNNEQPSYDLSPFGFARFH